MLALKFDPETGEADLCAENGQLVLGDELETLVYTSLFTHAHAGPGDVSEEGERGGYWGDDLDGYSHGSRLWLLRREKLTRETLLRVHAYATEALQWLVTEGRVARVTVTVERVGNHAVNLLIVLQRKAAGPWSKTYQWSAVNAA